MGENLSGTLWLVSRLPTNVECVLERHRVSCSGLYPTLFKLAGCPRWLRFPAFRFIVAVLSFPLLLLTVFAHAHNPWANRTLQRCGCREVNRPNPVNPLRLVELPDVFRPTARSIGLTAMEA